MELIELPCSASARIDAAGTVRLVFLGPAGPSPAKERVCGLRLQGLDPAQVRMLRVLDDGDEVFAMDPVPGRRGRALGAGEMLNAMSRMAGHVTTEVDLTRARVPLSRIAVLLDLLPLPTGAQAAARVLAWTA